MERPSKKRKTSLAHHALSIVLQQWMVPDLGWNTHHYETSLPSLREELIERRFKGSGLVNEQQELAKEEFRCLLGEEAGYIDHAYFIKIHNETHHEITQEVLFQKIRHNFILDMSYYDEDELVPDDTTTSNKRLYSVETTKIEGLNVFEKYVPISSMMLQHTSMAYTIKLYQEYRQLLCNMVKVFSLQQRKYAHAEGGLIVHQLVAWQALTQRFKLFELLLFDFALLPLAFEAEVQTLKVQLMHISVAILWDDFVKRRKVLEYFEFVKSLIRSIDCLVRHQTIVDIANGMLVLMDDITKQLECSCLINTSSNILTDDHTKSIHSLCQSLLSMKKSIKSQTPNIGPIHQTPKECSNINILSYQWEHLLLCNIFLDIRNLCEYRVHDNVHDIMTAILNHMLETFSSIICTFNEEPLLQNTILEDQTNTTLKKIIQSMYALIAMKQQITKYGDERYSTKCLQQRLYASYQLQYSICAMETYRLLQCDEDENEEEEEERWAFWVRPKLSKRIGLLEAITRLSDRLNRQLLASLSNVKRLEPNSLHMDVAYLTIATNCPVLEYYASMTCDVCSQNYDEVVFYAMFSLIDYLLERHSACDPAFDDIITVVNIFNAIVHNIWTDAPSLNSQSLSVQEWKVIMSVIHMFNRISYNYWRAGYEHLIESIQTIKEVLDSDGYNVFKFNTQCRLETALTLRESFSDIDRQLVAIQLERLRATILVEELIKQEEGYTENEPLLQQVKAMVLPILTLFDTIPIKAIAKTIRSTRKVFHLEYDDRTVLDNSNLVWFQKYLFWLETCLDVVGICLEVCLDVKTTHLSELSLSVSFRTTLLTSLDGTVELIKDILPLYSIFQPSLYNDHCSTVETIDWLVTSTSRYKWLHRMLLEDKETVTQELQRVGKLWKEECTQLGELVLRNQILETLEHKASRRYVLFN